MGTRAINKIVTVFLAVILAMSVVVLFLHNTLWVLCMGLDFKYEIETHKFSFFSSEYGSLISSYTDAMYWISFAALVYLIFMFIKCPKHWIWVNAVFIACESVLFDLVKHSIPLSEIEISPYIYSTFYYDIMPEKFTVFYVVNIMSFIILMFIFPFWKRRMSHS